MQAADRPIDEHGLHEAARSLCRHGEGLAEAGRVGLEVEAFPISVGLDGEPGARLSLDELSASLPRLGGADDGYASSAVPGPEPPVRLSLEPGAQLEVVTAPRDGVTAAFAAAEDAEGVLGALKTAHRVVLAHAGLDLWHPPSAIRQQLLSPRYRAMAAYFERRPEPDGPVMMRHTCALQVNLDLGPPDAAGERWAAVNLASPLLVATFACSPGAGAVSARALVWERTDPTRTGVPTAVVRGESDLAAALVECAMTADVMLVTGPDGSTEPGVPGWTFGEWMRRGHPRYGRPTRADVDRHLTTLFPVVRLRGWLEVRTVDALPRRWQPVPVVLLAGLLYDGQARREALRVLESYRPVLPQMLHRAATTGLADPALCALAVEVWSFALAGAQRLPEGYVSDDDLRLVEAYLDRYTLGGRCPADELREQFAISPGAALAWAAGSAQVPVAVP